MASDASGCGLRAITEEEATRLFPAAVKKWSRLDGPPVEWWTGGGMLVADDPDGVQWLWDPETGWDPA